MRLLALVAILVEFANPALAASPEDAYWAVRQHAIKRLDYKGREKLNDQAYADFETAALADLERRIIDIVGPVKVEGFSNQPKSHVVALSSSPDYGQLDGVEFLAKGHQGGALVVSTTTMLRFWLQERAKPTKAKWARGVADALKADAFYGDALDPENGFVSVADFALQTPAGAAFAAAKLGRAKDPGTDSLPRPSLIVTLVKDRYVFIAFIPPTTKVPQIAACAAEAASLDGAPLPDAWGPMSDPAFDVWISCERHELPSAPYLAQLKREAQQIGESLAHAK